jgi:hypothetical protein
VDGCRPPANNQVIDDHIIFALTLSLLACWPAGPLARWDAGRWLDAGQGWEQTSSCLRSLCCVDALKENHA